MHERGPWSVFICATPNRANRYASWLIDVADEGEVSVVAVDMDDDRPPRPDELPRGRVDVLLLGPSLAGEAAAISASVRRERRGAARTVVIAADRPDPTIVREAADAVLLEPIDRAELRSTVRTQLLRAKYRQQLETFYELVARRAALEAEREDEDPAGRRRRLQLHQQIAAARESVDRTLEELSVHEGYPQVFEDLLPDVERE